jgi:hypothetical protein
MPEEPGPLWRLIGPGIVAAGWALPPASSSFIPHLLRPVDLDQPQEPVRAFKIIGVRLVVLIWAIALFGTLSVLTFRDQLGKLFGG